MVNVFLLACLVRAASSDQGLISFPGNTWHEMNDPVMGGQSHGNWSVINRSFGRFQGTTKNVSFLHAPGFCRASVMFLPLKDVSASLSGGLRIRARTSTPQYRGFKIAFGSFRTPRHHGGHELEGSYKAGLAVPASVNAEWQDVFIKFTDFSWDWSDFTGDCATKDPDGYQHKCCSHSTPEVCPIAQHLSGINSVSVWAEGVEGDFVLDIKNIVATVSNIDPIFT